MRPKTSWSRRPIPHIPPPAQEITCRGPRTRARRLAARRALRVDVQRIERRARGHEQAVAVRAAEAEVGAALGQIDAADQPAVGIEDRHAVEALLARTPA